MPYGNKFVDLLGTLRRGTLLEDAAAQLQDLLDAIQETGDSGTLTLAIEIKPQKHDAGVLVITDKITSKVPRVGVAPTIAYLTPAGEITRRDPRQPALPESVDAFPDREGLPA